MTGIAAVVVVDVDGSGIVVGADAGVVDMGESGGVEEGIVSVVVVIAGAGVVVDVGESGGVEDGIVAVVVVVVGAGAVGVVDV